MEVDPDGDGAAFKGLRSMDESISMCPGSSIDKV